MMNINEDNVVYSATTTTISGSDEMDDDSVLRQRRTICGCANPRLGLLAAGVTELALGTVGLGLILLGPQNRHTVLHPFEDFHKVHVYSEQWEDTIQLLIEFWLPSFAYWILGAVLVIASITLVAFAAYSNDDRRMSVLLSWIFISTLLLAGSVAGILALFVAGASVLGLLPLILATMMQMYFYFVISDMTYFHWEVHGRPKEEDKEELVNSTV